MTSLTLLLDRDGLAVAAEVKKGFVKGSFGQVARRARLSQEVLAAKLGLNSRTLARRRHRLNASESERLLRAFRIFQLAEEVLGSREKARRWMATPAHGLRGALPLDCLDTEAGAAEVQRVLRAIEWGVYL
jgi:putative toxin-antitoxin system antitoxin component (TIGR02293 family)